MRGATVSAVAGALALALVSGCSPVTGVNDAGGDDDDDDAIDASAGPDVAWVRDTVTVQIQASDGSPRIGVRVIFNEPDGSVASTQNTDGSGRAQFDLFPHSSVSIAVTDDFSEFFTRHSVRTILGVMPGDNIVIRDRDEGFFSNTYMGDLRVEILNGFGGASQYELRVGCESLSTTDAGRIDWQLYESSCNGALQPVDVIVTARAKDYSPIAFSTHLGVPLNAATYTLVSSWRTDWDRMTISLANVPDGMSYAQAELAVWRRGLDYSLGEPGGILLGGDNAEFNLLFPPSFAERLTPQLIAFWGAFPDDIDGFAQYQRQTSASEGNLTLDLTDDVPPRVHDVTFQENGFEGSQVHYEVDDVVSGMTAGAGSIQWTQMIPGVGGNPDSEIEWEWFFIMPSDQESPITLPDVPPGSLSDGAWPPPALVPMTSAVVGFIDTNLVSGWEEFRQGNGFELIAESIGPSSPTGSEVSLSVGGLIGFD